MKVENLSLELKTKKIPQMTIKERSKVRLQYCIGCKIKNSLIFYYFDERTY